MRQIKLFFAVLGFILAAVGMALDHRLLVYAAMVALGIALAIRLFLQRQERDRDQA